MARVLINVPKRVRPNEAFEVKLLLSHPMESGQRRDSLGQAIPRDIINRFVCTYGDELVLAVDLFPAIAANPFFAFSVVATKSDVLKMVFTDDDGRVQTETVSITVE